MPPKPTGENPNLGKVVFKPLALPKAERKSLFVEYYYPALVVLFLIIATFSKAAGMSLYDATVTGLWIAAIVFFLSQAIRYLKSRANPELEKSAPLSAKPATQENVSGKAAAKTHGPTKPLSKPSPPAAPPTVNAKPYDKPFITPYAKKRLPETRQTDKKSS